MVRWYAHLLSSLFLSIACTERPPESSQAVADRFQRAFDAGASCEELFQIRNSADPKERARPTFNEMLRGVGCFSSASTRVAPGSGSTDVYSVNYKAGYMVCSADPPETLRQAGTENPDVAARWMAGGQKGEAYEGTYDGCLAGLLGEPSRFPESPSNDRVVDVPYSEIESALEVAGFTICDFIEFGENRGYGSVESRFYDVAVGECPAATPEVDETPTLGSIDVAVFENVTARDNGAAIHRDEIVNGRHFSGAAWTYKNLLIDLGHYVHRDIAERVKSAMSALPGAESQYFRFE